jgi:opacity protein-like surface antigen
MKKLLILLCLLPLLAAVVKADAFSDFKDHLNVASLKPFAADIGGLIGATDFNSGRALGFPGFEAGIDASIQAKPDTADTILRDAKVTAFGVPMVHAGAALPLVGADVMVRGVAYSGFSIMGAGLRYPLLKSGTLTKFIPDVSVSAYYDAISQDYFKGSHMSLDAVASFDIPVIKPFAGIGVDRTRIEVKRLGYDGDSGTISHPRYTLGVRLSPMPLLYVYGAYNILHGQTGYTVGAGLKF